jgi:hypothetical protein
MLLLEQRNNDYIIKISRRELETIERAVDFLGSMMFEMINKMTIVDMHLHEITDEYGFADVINTQSKYFQKHHDFTSQITAILDGVSK